MFDARATVSMVTVHDDRAGAGDRLAFPNMSSCAAVVCVLDGTLVGVHKTIGPIAAKQRELFDYARDDLISGARVHRIVIAGWGADRDSGVHPAVAIRNALGVPDAPVSYYSFGDPTGTYKTGSGKKKMTDLCTFAVRNGTGFPIITVKRTTKVANQNVSTATLLQQGHKPGSPIFRFGSVVEDVSSSHDHPINQSKFTQV